MICTLDNNEIGPDSVKLLAGAGWLQQLQHLN
jgi:hypothetical protein